MRLFSIFDTSPHVGVLSWLTPLSVLLLLISGPYSIKSPFQCAAAFTGFLHTTLDASLYESRLLILTGVFVRVFLLIVTFNCSGLLPYAFTVSSHISVATALAASFWVPFIAYGLLNSLGLSLAGLVPTGTPWVLLPLSNWRGSFNSFSLTTTNWHSLPKFNHCLQSYIRR